MGVSNKYTLLLKSKGFSVNDFIDFWCISRRTYERLTNNKSKKDLLVKMIDGLLFGYITSRKLRKNFDYLDGKLLKNGKPVGSDDGRGYLCTSIGSKVYKVHRLIFLYHYGFMPEFIDHIDGNKTNNRIENLRACTIQQNNHNAGLRSDNKSGFKGVSYDKNSKKWKAQIKLNRKSYHLGLFESADQANEVVKQKRLELHKEFSRSA